MEGVRRDHRASTLGACVVVETAAFAAAAKAAITEEERANLDNMSKRAFDKIKAGLEDAIAITRGEVDPASWRVHVPAAIDVRAIRRKLGMSQNQFAASFGFGLDAVQNWEQGPAPPQGPRPRLPRGHRPRPDAVRRALAPDRHRAGRKDLPGDPAAARRKSASACYRFVQPGARSSVSTLPQPTAGRGIFRLDCAFQHS